MKSLKSFFFFLQIFLLLIVKSKSFAQNADAGKDKYICKSSQGIRIGPDNPNGEWCYSWSPDDGTLSDRKSPNPIAKPSQTTEYELTVVGKDFSFTQKDKMKVIVVGPDDCCDSNPTITNALTKLKANNHTTPSIGSNFTPGKTEAVCKACLKEDDQKWYARVDSLKAFGSINVYIFPSYPNQMRVPNTPNPVRGGNINNIASSTNYWRTVIAELNRYDTPNYTPPTSWHSFDASNAHERFHYFDEYVKSVEHIWLTNTFETRIEQQSIEADKAQNAIDALALLKPLITPISVYLFPQSVSYNAQTYTVKDNHGLGSGAYAAAKAILNGYIAQINAFAAAEGWVATKSSINPEYSKVSYQESLQEKINPIKVTLENTKDLYSENEDVIVKVIIENILDGEVRIDNISHQIEDHFLYLFELVNGTEYETAIIAAKIKPPLSISPAEDNSRIVQPRQSIKFEVNLKEKLIYAGDYYFQVHFFNKVYLVEKNKKLVPVSEVKWESNRLKIIVQGD